MVGIVSGSGLGLYNTHRDTQGSHAAGSGGAQVNVTNGNLIIQALDETLSGVGADIRALRTLQPSGACRRGGRPLAVRG
jgi:hypothetical protein